MKNLVKRTILTLAVMALIMPAPQALANDIYPTVDVELTDVAATEDSTELASPEKEKTADTVSEQDIAVKNTTEKHSPIILDKPELLLLEPDPDPDPEPAVTAQYSGLVITQIQTSGGVGKTAEDLVEIRNNSPEPVDVTGWQLKYASAQTNNWLVVASIKSSESDLGWRIVLPAGASYLFASEKFVEGHSGMKVDQTFRLLLASESGRLGLFDGDGQSQGGVAWGSALSVDGEPAEMARGGGVIERRLMYNGWHQDSRDNKSDFTISKLRESYMIGQSEDVFDACLNINGLQAIAPEGTIRNSMTGNCLSEDLVSLNRCEGLKLNEIGANLPSGEQFIEVKNINSQELDISGCRLATNRNNKNYIFDEIKLQAGEVLAVKMDQTELTLVKTTRGTVYLLDSDENEIDKVTYDKLATNSSYSLVNGEWLQTYALTPGKENIFERWLPCDEGYFRNEATGRCNKVALSGLPVPCRDDQYRSKETGRCRNITAVRSLVPCKEGQYRSEETNRCRSIASAVSTIKPCADDQFRNPVTNRCKKIASTDELKECHEGYERNPQTNRCRKILTASTDTAPFAPQKVKQIAEGALGWWALGGVSILALAIAAWQWRFEASQLFRRVASIFTSKPN